MANNSLKIYPRDFSRNFIEILENLQGEIVSGRIAVTERTRSDLKPQMYNLKDQTFLPYYAINVHNSIYKFKDPANEELDITDVSFPRLFDSASGNRRIGNNINTILEVLFNIWNLSGINHLYNFQYVSAGVSKTLLVGPGILLKEDGTILFCLAFTKEFISKMNAIKGFKKFKDFYKSM